jgi:N-acetylmuramoyl-L-alanine amidase
MRPIGRLTHCLGLRRSGLLTALLVCWAAPSCGAALLLKGDLQSDRYGATLTLQLSGPVHKRLFVLPNPDRVVLDLPSTRMAPGWRRPGGTGVVRSVRSAAAAGGTLRVVLELERPLVASASLTKADRAGRRTLTLKLSGAAATSPAAAAADVEPAPAPIAAAHAPIDSDRDIVVAVDAGHGGEDPGASGRGGTHEKDITLAIARALAARIDATPGMRAVLTRDGDHFIPLRDRTARASAAGADMFVSIHADAVRNRDVEGASVYVLSERGASSEAARWLAERENAADLRGGVSLANVQDQIKPVLLDLSQSASIGASAEAADRVLGALDDVGAVRKPEVQRAGFVVLKSRDMPAMLVETAYISNPGEERKLCSADYQRRLAAAVQAGIVAYFRLHPPEGTAYARQRREAVAGGLNLARSAQ